MNIVLSTKCWVLTDINNSSGVWAGNFAADGDAVEVWVGDGSGEEEVGDEAPS